MSTLAYMEGTVQMILQHKLGILVAAAKDLQEQIARIMLMTAVLTHVSMEEHV